jgi:lauroyl/myristoyl acyltransferase
VIPQSGRIAESIQAFFYYALRLLPTEWASDIGGKGIRWNARTNRPDIIEGAKTNLRRHRPEASEAEIDAWVDDFLDGVGRVQAEMAVIHRFLREERVKIIGEENILPVYQKRPIVALCVHTGNWEVFAPVCQHLGITLNSIIQPPANALERRVLDNARRHFGIRPILPDIAGTRQAIRVLKEKGVVSMFPDEARDGRSMAPLFGRSPHAKGNLAIAARLARMTGASFVLGHCRRIGKCRFELRISEVFDLPAAGDSPDILADVAFLNGWIEPVVSKEIPRWYFLDDVIAPIEP